MLLPKVVQLGCHGLKQGKLFFAKDKPTSTFPMLKQTYESFITYIIQKSEISSCLDMSYLWQWSYGSYQCFPPLQTSTQWPLLRKPKAYNPFLLLSSVFLWAPESPLEAKTSSRLRSLSWRWLKKGPDIRCFKRSEYTFQRFEILYATVMWKNVTGKNISLTKWYSLVVGGNYMDYINSVFMFPSMCHFPKDRAWRSWVPDSLFNSNSAMASLWLEAFRCLEASSPRPKDPLTARSQQFHTKKMEETDVGFGSKSHLGFINSPSWTSSNWGQDYCGEGACIRIHHGKKVEDCQNCQYTDSLPHNKILPFRSHLAQSAWQLRLLETLKQLIF